MSGLMWCGIYMQNKEEALYWASRAAEVRNQAISGTFSQVSLGSRQSCALRTDGRVECWGGGEGAAPP